MINKYVNYIYIYIYIYIEWQSWNVMLVLTDIETFRFHDKIETVYDKVLTSLKLIDYSLKF